MRGMSVAIRRPRFRFSLRMLLLLTAIVAAWLGSHASVVNKRRAMLEALREDNIGQAVYRGNEHARSAIGAITTTVPEQRPRYLYPPASRSQPSTLRAWMGDRATEFIVLYNDIDISRYRRWFPEATCLVANRAD
jgi:hypothetical protein